MTMNLSRIQVWTMSHVCNLKRDSISDFFLKEHLVFVHAEMNAFSEINRDNVSHIAHQIVYFFNDAINQRMTKGLDFIDTIDIYLIALNRRARINYFNFNSIRN